MKCVLVSASLLLVSLLDQSLLQQQSAVLHSAKQLHSRGFQASLSDRFDLIINSNSLV